MVSDMRAAPFNRNRARAKGSKARPVARFSSNLRAGWCQWKWHRWSVWLRL